jgi:hypothetical protein
MNQYRITIEPKDNLVILVSAENEKDAKLAALNIAGSLFTKQAEVKVEEIGKVMGKELY